MTTCAVLIRAWRQVDVSSILTQLSKGLKNGPENGRGLDDDRCQWFFSESFSWSDNFLLIFALVVSSDDVVVGLHLGWLWIFQAWFYHLVSFCLAQCLLVRILDRSIEVWCLYQYFIELQARDVPRTNKFWSYFWYTMIYINKTQGSMKVVDLNAREVLGLLSHPLSRLGLPLCPLELRTTSKTSLALETR